MLRRNNFVSAVLIVVITSPHPVPCELGEFFCMGGYWQLTILISLRSNELAELVYDSWQ